ncbi:hypothetical protein PIB30_092291, partial [Stylosanthes scabra]|nr:hypothetical protein [Stylosanthes scabra]
MGERFDLVTDIHQRKMHWHIQVYVIRKYDVPSSEDPSTIKSIDLILQDSQGGMIHSSIPNRLMKVLEVEVPTFPLEAFRFRTIPKLTASAVVTEHELFDLVGEVVGKEDPRDLVTSTGKETKRMAINLQDLGKNTIRCVLFGPCVDDLTPLMAQERTEPLIVVLQFFRVNPWDGKTSVQSHFDISKLCFDPTFKEIQYFLTSMVDTGTTSSVHITQMPSQSSGQGTEELRRGQVDLKTIEEVWSLIE